jgi:hypothetical protein
LTAVLVLQLQAPDAAQAQSMPKFCEAEIQAQQAAELTVPERSDLEHHKAFNQSESSRCSVGTQLVRSHLDDNRGGRQPDASPVSACLMKLLAGAGVARNPDLAVRKWSARPSVATRRRACNWPSCTWPNRANPAAGPRPSAG